MPELDDEIQIPEMDKKSMKKISTRKYLNERRKKDCCI